MLLLVAQFSVSDESPRNHLILHMQINHYRSRRRKESIARAIALPSALAGGGVSVVKDCYVVGKIFTASYPVCRQIL